MLDVELCPLESQSTMPLYPSKFLHHTVKTDDIADANISSSERLAEKWTYFCNSSGKVSFVYLILVPAVPEGADALDSGVPSLFLFIEGFGRRSSSPSTWIIMGSLIWEGRPPLIKHT